MHKSGPGLLTVTFRSPRAASEVPHGASSLDSGATGGGCLGPGSCACPSLVSWIHGVVINQG